MENLMALQATVLDRKLRVCDLDELPHEWDTRYELVGGVLYMSRRLSTQHQETITRVIVALYPPVSALGGKVLPEAGLLWEEDGEDSVAPDVAVVLPDRLDVVGSKIRGAPNLVVEVLSSGPEAHRRDLEAKRALYFRRGVVEYWVLDLAARSFLRMTRGPSDWIEEARPETAVVRTPLLPAWKGVPVADLLPPR
jgi:Uma2 family endonuclease